MFEGDSRSHTIVQLNDVRLFAACVDENFTDSNKAVELKRRIDELKEVESLEAEYVFNPERNYFFVEFMKITSLMSIIEKYMHLQNDSIDYATAEFQSEMLKKLNTILNNL
ncbi:MAG: hypothetical protein ACLQG5_03800 [Methanobacterium sp.]